MSVRRSCLWLSIVLSLSACGAGSGLSPVAGSASAGQQTLGSGTTTTLRTYQYTFGESNISALEADPTANALLVKAASNGLRPYVIMRLASPPYETTPPAPAAWNPHYCLRWTSEEQMALDVASGQIPSYIDCFSYDNEANTLPSTPLNEQQDPPPYYTKAANLAVGHVSIFFPTAGVTFVSGSVFSSANAEASALWQTATSWTAAGKAVYGIQSQTAETNLTQFNKVISTRMSSVLAMNSKVSFTIGVGDYAAGACQPYTAMVTAAQSAVAGYPFWSNVGPNPGCVTANYPDTAAFIDALGY